MEEVRSEDVCEAMHNVSRVNDPITEIVFVCDKSLDNKQKNPHIRSAARRHRTMWSSVVMPSREGVDSPVGQRTPRSQPFSRFVLHDAIQLTPNPLPDFRSPDASIYG